LGISHDDDDDDNDAWLLVKTRLLHTM
jgi:hypothetical protein